MIKIKFLAKNIVPEYSINSGVINGIDTGLFVEGSHFLGNNDTLDAGIYDMYWQDGVLHITLGQKTKTTDIPWAAREWEWIDITDYSPIARYTVATNIDALSLIDDGKAEYFRDTDGAWTVRMIKAPEQESEA